MLSTQKDAISLLVLVICLLAFQSCMPSLSVLERNPNFKWHIDSSQNFRYYFEKQTLSQTQLDSIKSYTEKDFADVMQKLDVKKYPHLIHYFVLDDYQKCQKLAYHSPEIFLNDTTGLSDDNWMITTLHQHNYSHRKHHLARIIASLSGPFDDFLYEGLGLYVNDSYKGYDLHTLAAYLQKHQQPLWLNIWSNPSATPQIGSFFKFIIENYGVSDLFNIYKNNYYNLFEYTDFITVHI